MYSLVIVDDETELLEGLSHYFPWESIGFVVTGSFIDGRTALQYCTHNRPDVVLTDIRMACSCSKRSPPSSRPRSSA